MVDGRCASACVNDPDITIDSSDSGDFLGTGRARSRTWDAWRNRSAFDSPRLDGDASGEY